MNKVLIVDDDVSVTNYLMVFMMQTEKYEPTVINDSREIPELLKRENFDAMILDMDMPYISGFDILKMIREKNISTPVIVLTGVADVELAVDSMKIGAFDYLTKPVDDNHLLEVIDKAIEHQSTHYSIQSLPSQLTRDGLKHKKAFEHLPTVSPKMIRLFHQAEKMAAGDLSIFIWGEIGTGKRFLAEAIHKASPRSDKPFLVVDTTSQDSVRFPADFFGQAKDWSGSRADRPGFLEEVSDGTLFLDDIDGLSMPMQSRLKRVIQNGEFYREGSTKIQSINVRFIGASNHDLTSEEYKESFDRDLLYHLMINSIWLPPLRERVDDIPMIAETFLDEENAKSDKDIKGFAPEFMQILQHYHFPSNLRELRHIIATAVINEDGQMISMSSVSPYIRDMLTKGTIGEAAQFEPRKLADVAREHVLQMLDYFGDDREKAAKELGIKVDKLNKIINGDSAF
jgi:DNA-binding NtrC family response regulator